MGITVRNDGGRLGLANAVVHNLKLRDDTETDSTYPHADVTSTTGGGFASPTPSALHVTATNATTLPTGITLAENIRSVMLIHFADAGSALNAWGGAHKAADTVNAALISYDEIPELTAASSQDDLDDLLNAEKAAWNAHMSQSGVHFITDSVTTIGASDASNLGESETLANELKTDVNTHIDFAGAAHTVIVTPA